MYKDATLHYCVMNIWNLVAGQLDRPKFSNFSSSSSSAINVPTAGAEAFLMDYTLEEWAIIYHVGLERVGR
jgi:hypothetical protein